MNCQCFQKKGTILTRNASEGSVPAIAPALAAVKLSTSSSENRIDINNSVTEVEIRRTYHNDHKAVFFVA